MNAVAAAETHNLRPGALGSRLHMPTSFVGTDEVFSALRADPLASDNVVFKAFKVGLCRLWSGADKRQVKAICGTAPGVSDKSGFAKPQYLPEGGRRERRGRKFPGGSIVCQHLVLVWKIKREREFEGGGEGGWEVSHRVERDAEQGLTMRSVGCTIWKPYNNQPRGSQSQGRRERIPEQGPEQVIIRLVTMLVVRVRTNRWKGVVCVHHSREKSEGGGKYKAKRKG
jgi:hypothetical protein